MKQLERRLGNLEKRTGSQLIVLKVVYDRDCGSGLTKEEMHTATQEYLEAHPDEQHPTGILVLYFKRDESGKVKAVNQWDSSQQDKGGQR